MIARSDETLLAWLADVARGVEVSLEPPGSVSGDPALHAYLLGVADRASGAAGGAPPPIRLRLDYLLSARAPTAAEAHALFDSVLVASLERADAQVRFPPADSSLWASLGVQPRPALLLQVPVEQARSYEPAPPVRERVLRRHGLRTVSGVLLGPRDVPLPDAALELVGTGRRGRTDAAGRFRIDGVPAELPISALRIRTHGRELCLDAARVPDPSQPWAIRLDSLES